MGVKDRGVPIMPEQKQEEGRIILIMIWGALVFVLFYAILQVFNDFVDISGILILPSLGLFAPTAMWIIVIVVVVVLMIILALMLFKGGKK